MASRLARWLTRTPSAPSTEPTTEPEPTPAAPRPALPDDMTDAELVAAAIKASELGYGRGGSRGCMIPGDVLAALVAQERATGAEAPSE